MVNVWKSQRCISIWDLSHFRHMVLFCIFNTLPVCYDQTKNRKDLLQNNNANIIISSTLQWI